MILNKSLTGKDRRISETMGERVRLREVRSKDDGKNGGKLRPGDMEFMRDQFG